MKRHLTVIGIAVIAGLAFALYNLKYQVHGLEARRDALTQAIAAEYESVRLLKAEWSFLNNPKRLADLAKRHLDLVPLDASRIVSLDDFPRVSRQPSGESSAEPATRDAKTSGTGTKWLVGAHSVPSP